MKPLILLIAIFSAIYCTWKYTSTQKPSKKNKNNKEKRNWLTAAGISTAIVIVWIIGAVHSASLPDTQCKTTQTTVNTLPTGLKTARDYFDQGNKWYDLGDCALAIRYYSQAIELDPNFAQAYNNRAYTNMRLQNYKEALPDLNKAIELQPSYVNALMNRGDLYNYYGPVLDKQKAISDYDRVIALGPDAINGTSVCGHWAMAMYKKFIPLVFFEEFILHNPKGC